MPHERIPTSDPIRHLWTRFGALESVSGAARHIRHRAEDATVDVSEDVVEAKAQGLAFAIRNAHEYFRIPVEGNMTVACVSYYYGTLSLLQALLLADPENGLTLADMEAYTKKGGHGMGLISNAAEGFPDGENVYVLTSGFLPRFLKAAKYPLRTADIALSRNPASYGDVPEVERSRLASVAALFSRIPELLSIYIDMFDRQPDYLGIQIVGRDPGARIHFPAAGNSPHLTPEIIRERLSWGADVEIEHDPDADSLRTTQLQPVTPLLEGKAKYESVLAYASYVTPLNGIDDVLVMQFMLLYALSIWVRYRPALWREISEGDKDEYRSLVMTFLIAVERVIPNELLNRIYGRSFLFAPFSYWS